MSTTSAPLTIYSTPNCIQCQMTFKILDRTGIDYEVLDLTDEDQHGRTKVDHQAPGLHPGPHRRPQ